MQRSADRGEAGDDMSLPNGPQGQKNIKEKRYSE